MPPQPKHTQELPKVQAREIGGSVIIEFIEVGNWTGRPLSMFKAAPDLLAALKAWEAYDKAERADESRAVLNGLLTIARGLTGGALSKAEGR